MSRLANTPPIIETLISAIVADLRPSPGRLSRSLRIAAACVVVVFTSMALETPETAVSCYLIFFASKESAASSVLQSLKLIIGSAVGIAIAFVFLMLCADQPELRIILVAVFAFLGMFFAHASRLGPIASTIGFVLAFSVSLFDVVPSPELLTRGAIWMWAVVALPMLALIVVDGLFAPRAPQLVRDRIACLLDDISLVLRGSTDADARTRIQISIGQGLDGIEEELAAAKTLATISAAKAEQLSALAAATHELASLVLGSPTADLCEESATISDWARAVRFSIPPTTPWHEPSDPFFETIYGSTLRRIHSALTAEGSVVSAAHLKQPLLVPGAYSDRSHVQFAVKGCLAASISYLAYTSSGWFGIHTALVTCFFVSLSSVGETVHKLTLRIVGCLIGAALGVGTILLLMPRMEDVGQLSLLVAAVAVLAAWIGAGSPRISYMGWQIAFAYFLCVLHGHGPTFDLVVARDRILGIILGNVIVTVVFTQLWPVSVVDTAKELLRDALRKLASAASSIGVAANDFVDGAVLLARARAALELQTFEPSAAAVEKSRTQALAEALIAAQEFAASIAVTVAIRNEDTKGLLPSSVAQAEETQSRAVSVWLTEASEALGGGMEVPQLNLSPLAISQIKSEALPVSAWGDVGVHLLTMQRLSSCQQKLASALSPLVATGATR